MRPISLAAAAMLAMAPVSLSAQQTTVQVPVLTAPTPEMPANTAPATPGAVFRAPDPAAPNGITFEEALLCHKLNIYAYNALSGDKKNKEATEMAQINYAYFLGSAQALRPITAKDMADADDRLNKMMESNAIETKLDDCLARFSKGLREATRAVDAARKK